MGYTRKHDKQGKFYYSFLVYDSKLGKNIRLKKQDVRNRFGKDIVSEVEAQKTEKLLKAEYDSSKERFKRILEWKKKYFEFSKLLEQYTVKQKKKAPYGYRNNVHYLKYYVLPYFLNIAKNNNINNWNIDYSNFKDWLEDEAKLIQKPNQLISYASKNHAIKALNTFIKHLRSQGIINDIHICEAFDECKLSEKTIDDVIQENESNIIYQNLLDSGFQNEAEFFLMLYWTGIRFNEGLGISLDDLHKGEIDRKSFGNLLNRNRIFYKGNGNSNNLYDYHGFLTLSSQPDNDNSSAIKREPNGKVLRKALKMKKSINEKHTRIIPIINKELWRILVRRAKDAQAKFKNSENRSLQKSDFLLFEGINQTTATGRLKRSFEKSNLKYRSWHCCRHSRGTFLHGKTGDKELGMKWLGHTSDKVYERYIHTYEGLVREIKAKEVDWDEEQ